MHLHLPKCVLATAVFLIHVRTSLCVYDAQYLSCRSTFQCGNIPGVGYPFWRPGREPYCGYPDPQFELACTGETAEISLGEATYKILHMDKMDKSLRLVRKDYPPNLCFSGIGNVTLNYTTFGHSSDNTYLNFFYKCPTIEAAPRFNLSSSRLSCDNRTGYYVSNNMEGFELIEESLAGCEERVVMPLYDSVAVLLKTGRATKDLVVAAIDNGFGLMWDAENTLCDSCDLSGGVCGHSLTSGGFTCFCRDKPYSTTCGGTDPEVYRRVKIAIAVGIAGGMIGIGMAIMCALSGIRLMGREKFLRKKENDLNERNKTEAFIRNHGYLCTKQFSYSCVKKMTNSFSDKLGQGGYGTVYKGTMEDGRLVAVKILKDSKNDNGEFLNEVVSISRTSHVNVVALLGFCYERNNKALLYEFMPNGSLDRFIYNNGSLNRLEWDILFQIACGIARGLEYLHRGCSTRIVHFDIKPHNILLDKDLVPKISDFGLAKLCTRDESVVSMTGARGTMGYISPEVFCRNFGGVSHKSDVYSYGMMVLEMVGGRKNICVGGSETNESFIPSRVYRQVESGETLNVEGVGTEEENEIARKMTLVSLWCIQTMPESRPSMRKVLEMLEASVESLQIPPKPTLMSPPRSPQHSLTICTQQQSFAMSLES